MLTTVQVSSFRRFVGVYRHTYTR